MFCQWQSCSASYCLTASLFKVTTQWQHSLCLDGSLKPGLRAILIGLLLDADAQGADKGGLQGQALELGFPAAGPRSADRDRGPCQHLSEDR